MFYPEMTDPKIEKPSDMADHTMISSDGINPVAYDPEREWGKNGTADTDFNLHFPGVIPPAYFPGYPGPEHPTYPGTLDF